MYESSEFIETPKDARVLWRYMDFPKFLWTVQNEALYFARGVSMPDPFEGALTDASWWDTVEGRRYVDVQTGQVGAQTDEAAEAIKAAAAPTAARIRELGYINCWHENDFESAAMWDLYAGNALGVAIRTNAGRMKKAFKGNPHPVHVGRVEYIDYGHDTIEETNIFSPFFYKRKSFEHENEVRALTFAPDYTEYLLDSNKDLAGLSHGIVVPVRLDLLADTVFVAPNAPEWAVEVVTATVGSSDLRAPVVQSDLYTPDLR